MRTAAQCRILVKMALVAIFPASIGRARMVGDRRERILLVDDDDSIRQVVTVFLTDEGYEVAGAGDGQAALDLLATFKPDIILLDLRMPVMDGWEFVRL